MSMFNKLIGVWVVNKTVSSTTPLLMRLLMGMAAISMVTIFTAFLAALITGAGVWLMYHELVANGMSAPNAMFVMGLLLLMLLFILLVALQYYWRRITLTFKQIVYAQSPVTGKVNSLVDSFLAGFNTPTPRTKE